MKKITFLLIIIFYISCSNNESEINESDEIKTFIGNVLLQTQEQINLFGEEQYEKISGELTIRPPFGSDDITDLSSLSSIESIESHLSISNCDILDNLKLNIKEVASILITNNNHIKTIDFPYLKNVKVDYLFIENNSLLENINFSKLESIATHLGIQNNPKILNLNGFSSLEIFDSNSTSNLYISRNQMLTSIESLNKVNSNIGLLQMENNESIPDLQGLENMRFGAIAIVGNSSMNNFCAIKNAIENGNIDGDSFSVNNGLYYLENNLYNPTVNEMISGNCSQ